MSVSKALILATVVGLIALPTFFGGSDASPPPSLRSKDVSKQLAMLSLAVQEYAEAMEEGRVVAPSELETAENLVAVVMRAAPSPELEAVEVLMESRAEVANIVAAFETWVARHAAQVGVAFPRKRPSVAQGARLFGRYCSSCHGSGGDGRGPLADEIVAPKPADFTDRSAMSGETPVEFFQVMSIGLPGTAMPGWEEVLTAQERWDLVAYLWGLRNQGNSDPSIASERCGSCHRGSTAPDLTRLVLFAGSSDSELADRLRASAFHRGSVESDGPAWVAMTRSLAFDSGRGREGGEPAAVDPRHLLVSLDLLADEYAAGIAGGRVVNSVEYGEARLFMAKLEEDLEYLLGAEAIDPAVAERIEDRAAALKQAVYAKADALVVVELTEDIGATLRSHLGLGAAAEIDLSSVMALLGRARALASDSPEPAAPVVLEAYMVFEKAERRLGARDQGLARSLERRFADLRAELSAGGDGGEAFSELQSLLLRADEVLRAETTHTGALSAALLIILREGLEAILIIGALAAYLVKAGNLLARRWLLEGAVAGVVASLVTAVVIERVLGGAGLAQELIEGTTMLLAAVVLFVVSYWLISRAEARRWQIFVHARLSRALGTGSRAAMMGVAFLAVYREGFETILFYRALLAQVEDSLAVAGGFGLGCIALFVVFLAIFKFGLSVPLRPFFSLTGSLLYVLAFRFVGGGITELQEGGVVSLTPVTWWPDLSWFGMAANLETALGQLVLVGAALAALAAVRYSTVTVPES
ncbi:MAG: FTR1 family protein [Candidatus Binatia bacterium]